jgi:two-component system OmpR family response regulator
MSGGLHFPVPGNHPRIPESRQEERARMATKEPTIVYEHDVYALSPRGEEELHASETSLAPAEIELLVRIDGKLSVADIAQSTRLLAPDAVIAAMGRLLEGKFVKLKARPASSARGVADLFSGRVPAPPTRRAMTDARADATAGVSSLQKQGYFVRIAKRARTLPKITDRSALSVLVVEDEPLLARFLKQYLSFDGFDVRLAANRGEVVAAFREPPVPHLVLLDVMLPDVDGFDILAKIRQHPALEEVPVIMMTAKATREAVLKGLAGGAHGYITKPFEADAMLKAVKTVLGLPKDYKPATAAGDHWTFGK